MTTKKDTQEMDLNALLRSVGESFTSAQRSMLGEINVPANMMLSNAELELKGVVYSDTRGTPMVRMLTTEDIARNEINPSMISTLKIGFTSVVGNPEEEPVPVSPTTPPQETVKVPDLKGLSLQEAVSVLKKNGWSYTAHAAAKKDVDAAGRDSFGLILKQKPTPTAKPRKDKTIDLWVNLGSTPVTEIDGIGEKTGKTLAGNGIRSVGELSLTKADRLAKILQTNEQRAQGFIDMANLMSKMTLLGLKDEVVELLVKGVGIRSLGELSKTDPEKLLRLSKKAIQEKRIQTPRAFNVTQKDVEEWIRISTN
ncbi:DUF4332 domain-containing protein [Verrucomicrobia bacterium S94]|nr:DUF4332 domain-containing protein [Verrucomicrobia bacterium S94]